MHKYAKCAHNPFSNITMKEILAANYMPKEEYLHTKSATAVGSERVLFKIRNSGNNW